MTLGSAALLLLLSAVGIAASRVCLRQKSALGTVCLVVCALAAPGGRRLYRPDALLRGRRCEPAAGGVKK